jgi:hypothetical protein
MSLKESIDYFSSVYIFKALKDFFLRNESQQRTRSRVREELKIGSFGKIAFSINQLNIRIAFL